MENFKSIDDEYYVGQNSKHSSWTIMRAWDGQDRVVGYYNQTSRLLTWTDAMGYEDKEFVEKWVNANL